MALKNPILSNPITVDIPKLNEILDALSKANPTDVDGISTGAMRLYEVSSGKWQWQVYNGSTWASVPFLQHNVDQLDGYHAAITPAANTVAVRNASGLLQDSITGNAATASSAATLSEMLPVNKGGTGATTSAAARTNLGVPPTSHTSTATTYGVGNSAQYGHLKLSDATDSASGASGGVAATPAAVKAAKDAAMEKASTLATATKPGIAYFPTPFTVGADGKAGIREATTEQAGIVQLNNTVTSTSTTQAATPAAVKQAYDKAVEADDKAGITRLFNSRLVITESNTAWTPPVTGWALVTVIGGGGAGGGGGLFISGSIYGGGKGGGQGGTTSFGEISAAGGSGGGGGAYASNGSESGGGGGEAGKVVQGYVFIRTDRTITIIIGAGGIASTSDPSTSLKFGTAGKGPNGGYAGSYLPSYDYGHFPGGGAPGAGSGGMAANFYCGSGGSGGINGTGYGGGGGGSAGYDYVNYPASKNTQGQAGDGGSPGYFTSNNRSFAGNGGPGAVIVEYYDPAKEVA